LEKERISEQSILALAIGSATSAEAASETASSNR
jgi:hypothetical protein